MSQPEGPSETQLAAGMLAIAQQRMLRAYPFHARFVASWHSQATETVSTVGVTIRQGQIALYYNPAFVVSCSYEQMIGVLLHETHHLLFDHPFQQPADFPDEEALLIAQEVTVNEWIREPLPGSPIVLAQFPTLPPNEDTLRRYERLAAGCKQPKPSQTGRKSAPTSPKTAPNDPKSSQTGQKSAMTSLKTDLNDPKSAPNSEKSTGSEQLAERAMPLDDHELWQDIRNAGALGRMAVRVSAQKAAEQLTAEQWQALPDALRERLVTLGHGDDTKAAYDTLEWSRQQPMAWRRLLRRYVRQATEVQPVFNRPPRRFAQLLGVVPGQQHRPTRSRVMAVIDTSGSMRQSDLEHIAGELDAMARHHRVTVVECDAAIHRVYTYDSRLAGVHGRGGTDLRPPFASNILAKIQPDVVVYFTDGCGPAPERPPAVPVVWCVLPGGQKPASWGREICLPAAP